MRSQLHAAGSRALLAAGAVVVALATPGCGGGDSGDADRASTETSTQPGARVEPFPDAFNEAPPGWNGPEFRLSQDYPTSDPGLGPAPWKKFNFRTQSKQYLDAVLDYALEGNIDVDFRGQDNPVRKWYHAPWMHSNRRSGREFIHGMTRERPSEPKFLAPTQTTQVE